MCGGPLRVCRRDSTQRGDRIRRWRERPARRPAAPPPSPPPAARWEGFARRGISHCRRRARAAPGPAARASGIATFFPRNGGGQARGARQERAHRQPATRAPISHADQTSSQIGIMRRADLSHPCPTSCRTPGRRPSLNPLRPRSLRDPHRAIRRSVLTSRAPGRGMPHPRPPGERSSRANGESAATFPRPASVVTPRARRTQPTGDPASRAAECRACSRRQAGG
jgi:hypothetical protein